MQHKAVAHGWSRLTEERLEDAEQAVVPALDTPAGRLLSLQIGSLRSDRDISQELAELATNRPSYASSWLTLSVEAEKHGHEATALNAARTGAQLWPSKRWTGRVRSLETRWIEARIERAQSVLAEGRPTQALELAELALSLVPGQREAVLVEARALMALDRIDDAERVLSKLPSDAEATLISAEISERRQDWLGAMERYSALPTGHPSRDASLRRVQLRWRLSQLPEYAQQALASPDLTRAELAVLVVSLAPQVKTLATGHVSLLSDIVELPYQQEILIAVGSGLLTADTLEHRFHPARKSSAGEVKTAIESLAALLEAPAPTWCDSNPVVQSSCTSVSHPVTGRALTEIVLQVVQGDVQ